MDKRFDIELLADIFEVLDRHGYQRPPGGRERDMATGSALGALATLVHAYEGHKPPRG